MSLNRLMKINQRRKGINERFQMIKLIGYILIVFKLVIGTIVSIALITLIIAAAIITEAILLPLDTLYHIITRKESLFCSSWPIKRKLSRIEDALIFVALITIGIIVSFFIRESPSGDNMEQEAETWQRQHLN